MNRKILYLLSTLLLTMAVTTGAHGHEEAVVPEQKEKPPAKPTPDTSVGFVMNAPEVKKWRESLEAKNDGEFLTAWGEAMKNVAENQCPPMEVSHKTNGEYEGPHICECAEVAIAAGTATDEPHIWAHFCVTAGGSLLVERRSKKPDGEITYMLYDDWKKKCGPTDQSPGRC